MAITAKELARLLGLSETAISLALNNKPGVSNETRRMVIEAATRYGYDFSRIRGKRAQMGHQNSVAVLMGPYQHMAASEYTIFDGVTEGIREACSALDTTCSLVSLDANLLGGEGLERLLGDFRQNEVDGIIVLGADVPVLTVSRLAALDIPIVTVDAFYHELSCSAVTVSNRLGGRLASAYLCDTYLSEPGYLRCRYRVAGFDERILGFMETVRYKALSRHKVNVQTLSPTVSGARNDLGRLLDEGLTLPRAIFAETDQLAMGAAQAILDHGLRIPEDVAIMGFDDITAAKDFEVPLTTIGYPKALMGIEAAKRLVDLIRNPSPYTTNTEVTTTLVKRASA